MFFAPPTTLHREGPDMNWLEAPLRAIDRVSGVIVGAMLVAITMILFTNAFARYFAGFAIIGGEELARCLMIWMTFLGSYLLVRTQSHIVIDVFSRLLPEQASRIANFLICLLGLSISIYFFVLGYDLTQRIFGSGQRMSSLPFARAWFYLSVPVGMGLMILAFIQQLLSLLTGRGLPLNDDFIPPEPVSVTHGPDLEENA